MNNSISRRSAITRLAGSAVAVATASLARHVSAEDAPPAKLKGNINHSACRWCYKDIPLEDLCVAAKEMGLKSIDLLGPKEFPVVQKHGLICAMVNGVPGGITSGLNRVENHDKILKYFEADIPRLPKPVFPT